MNNYVDITVGIESLKQTIASSTSSRHYITMNPDLTVLYIYKCRGKTEEIYRIAYSRLRVIGHNLAIETGSWNRREQGRLEQVPDIPVYLDLGLEVVEPLCLCSDVQTELHVLESCPLAQNARHITLLLGVS